LETFLLALGNREWDKMVEVSQLTWRATRENPVEEVEAMLGWMNLVKFRIFCTYPVQHEILPKGTMVDAKCFVEYKLPTGETRERNVMIRLACEKAPHEPDAEGTWGVNPISIREASLTTQEKKPDEKPTVAKRILPTGHEGKE
jgi:hypothetical protein